MAHGGDALPGKLMLNRRFIGTRPIKPSVQKEVMPIDTRPRNFDLPFRTAIHQPIEREECQ
jgi:hypothetical protein